MKGTKIYSSVSIISSAACFAMFFQSGNETALETPFQHGGLGRIVVSNAFRCLPVSRQLSALPFAQFRQASQKLFEPEFGHVHSTHIQRRVAKFKLHRQPPLRINPCFGLLHGFASIFKGFLVHCISRLLRGLDFDASSLHARMKDDARTHTKGKAIDRTNRLGIPLWWLAFFCLLDQWLCCT